MPRKSEPNRDSHEAFNIKLTESMIKHKIPVGKEMLLDTYPCNSPDARLERWLDAKELFDMQKNW